MGYFGCGINQGTFQLFVYLNVGEETERKGGRKNPKGKWDCWSCTFCVSQDSPNRVERWELRANSDVYQREMLPALLIPGQAAVTWAVSLMGHLAVGSDIKRGKATS